MTDPLQRAGGPQSRMTCDLCGALFLSTAEWDAHMAVCGTDTDDGRRPYDVPLWQ